MKQSPSLEANNHTDIRNTPPFMEAGNSLTILSITTTKETLIWDYRKKT
jgi:hypothetical protein